MQPQNSGIISGAENKSNIPTSPRLTPAVLKLPANVAASRGAAFYDFTTMF